MKKSKKINGPVVETPVVETPVVETPVVETPVVETPAVETLTDYHVVGQQKMVDYRKIGWLWSTDNSRTESFGEPLDDIAGKKETPKGLGRPLSNGWNQREAVTIVTIEHYAELTGQTVEQLQLRVKQERQKLIDKWRSTPGLGATADVAERLWSKHDIRYIANECYRRGYSVPGAIAYRLQRGIDAETAFEYSVPAIIKEFATPLSLLLAHYNENDKTTGQSPYAANDFVSIARATADRCGIEADVTRACGARYRGQVQRGWRLMKIGCRLKEANILTRCKMERPEPVDDGTGKKRIQYVPGGYIDVGALDKEHLANLLEDRVFSEKKGGKQQTLTLEVFEEYVESRMGNSQKKSNILATSVLKEIADTTEVEILALILKAILTGDKLTLVSLNARATAINEALAGIA